MGISFFGTAFSEPKLIKLASGFEAATHVRAKNLPTFARTVPFDHIAGTTLTGHHHEEAPGKNNGTAAPPFGATVQPRKVIRRPHAL
jgi:hypothetical protein